MAIQPAGTNAVNHDHLPLCLSASLPGDASPAEQNEVGRKRRTPEEDSSANEGTAINATEGSASADTLTDGGSSEYLLRESVVPVSVCFCLSPGLSLFASVYLCLPLSASLSLCLCLALSVMPIEVLCLRSRLTQDAGTDGVSINSDGGADAGAAGAADGPSEPAASSVPKRMKPDQ